MEKQEAGLIFVCMLFAVQIVAWYFKIDGAVSSTIWALISAVSGAIFGFSFKEVK